MWPLMHVTLYVWQVTSAAVPLGRSSTPCCITYLHCCTTYLHCSACFNVQFFSIHEDCEYVPHVKQVRVCTVTVCLMVRKIVMKLSC